MNPRLYVCFSFIHQYSALEARLAGTRAQSFDWYGSGTLHPGQVLGGSLPLLSPTSASIQQKIMLETKNVCQNTPPSLIHLLQEQVQRQMPVNTIISLGLYKVILSLEVPNYCL